MPELSSRRVLAYLAATLAVVLVGARVLSHPQAPEDGKPPSAPAVAVQAPEQRTVVVHVAGAVRRPGVYRLKAAQRVDDAIQRAGGPKAGADLNALNLAARVEDGRQVLVPVVGGRGVGGAAGGAAPSPAVGAGSAPGTPLDLNQATPEQLDALDGIGPTTARKIIAYRDQHGGFRSVDELDQVPGIGPARLAVLRALVRV